MVRAWHAQVAGSRRGARRIGARRCGSAWGHGRRRLLVVGVLIIINLCVTVGCVDDVAGLSSLLLLAFLGSSILEPYFDLALGQLELPGYLLLPRYGDVLVEPELVLELDPLGVVIDYTVLVLGSGFVLGHFCSICSCVYLYLAI